MPQPGPGLGRDVAVRFEQMRPTAWTANCEPPTSSSGRSFLNRSTSPGRQRLHADDKHALSLINERSLNIFIVEKYEEIYVRQGLRPPHRSLWSVLHTLLLKVTLLPVERLPRACFHDVFKLKEGGMAIALLPQAQVSCDPCERTGRQPTL